MILKRDTFADDMRREHRTIQQLDAPAIFAVILQWARDYESGNFDARNETTCHVASNMIEGLRARVPPENFVSFCDDMKRFFPYI